MTNPPNKGARHAFDSGSTVAHLATLTKSLTPTHHIQVLNPGQQPAQQPAATAPAAPVASQPTGEASK